MNLVHVIQTDSELIWKNITRTLGCGANSCDNYRWRVANAFSFVATVKISAWRVEVMTFYTHFGSHWILDFAKQTVCCHLRFGFFGCFSVLNQVSIYFSCLADCSEAPEMFHGQRDFHTFGLIFSFLIMGNKSWTSDDFGWVCHVLVWMIVQFGSWPFRVRGTD